MKWGKPIALLVFIANLNDISDNCGVCVEKKVWILVYLSGDFAEEVYKAYIASIRSSKARVNHEKYPLFINVLIQQFLAKKVFQEAHADKNALEFKVERSKATKQFRHIYTVMEEVIHYVLCLRPCICGENLEKTTTNASLWLLQSHRY